MFETLLECPCLAEDDSIELFRGGELVKMGIVAILEPEKEVSRLGDLKSISYTEVWRCPRCKRTIYLTRTAKVDAPP